MLRHDPKINEMWESVAFFGLVAAMVAIKFLFDPFRRHKTALAEVSHQYELRYYDEGNRATISGVVEGAPIEVVSEHRLKHTRQEHIQVRGSMTLPGAPPGFNLIPEGIATGMERLASRREVEFGHPDFDDAFWVTADDPTDLERYLTEERRHALLHWLYQGGGRVENGVWELTGTQGDFNDGTGRILSRFIGLAKSLAGESQYHQAVLEMKPGWVAARKIRNLAFWTGLMALLFWWLPRELPLQPWYLDLNHALLGLSLAATLAALLGRRKPTILFAGLLGVGCGLVLLGATCVLVVFEQYLAAVVPLVLAISWILVWGGALYHLFSLKGGGSYIGGAS